MNAPSSSSLAGHTASGVNRLREDALRELPHLRTRYADAFRPVTRNGILGVTLAVGLLALFITGFAELGFSFAKMIAGLDQLGKFVILMWPPTPGTMSRFLLFVHALGETVAIAALGTVLAAILALPFGFLAAKNVVANRIVHFLSRRLLDTVRGVDTLIWALLWVNVVGLGPFAGVLAIMCSDTGALGKLFSEAIETANRRPVEGVLSAGGGRLAAVRFGILPQVLPVFASQLLYYFESNTRSATIIGIVGAGGIGLHLSEQIRTLEWQHVAFLVILILATVAVIDALSTRLRSAIIGSRPAAT
ncbi:phosphonate ABC transporter, permease protein PhnE [Chelatococcus asaccharovorans]|uniref:phosphonate ABC transporter, permease protein PhnE n=1 Tax=Chelatococcus asaccharovorans TaxID=28210 RepID=UPI00224C684A|nr:phosphonate ABC transporter, permease protein PhnE [Chelatococcus asaccharovorans]CAH1649145.1 Phosphonate transport system permease protein [Chelatococcus asaccharovorans]CAH1687153.1 Phosphonate transport system permease protein [Chelatococcus asaccharovorans]